MPQKTPQELNSLLHAAITGNKEAQNQFSTRAIYEQLYGEWADEKMSDDQDRLLAVQEMRG